MVRQKKFRLPDKLASQLERDVKEKGFASENDWGIEAIRHFLSCKKLDTTGAMKLIVLKYPAKCLKCTSPIDAGEWALWGRGIGAVCMDCYVQRIGDKALVAKYLKMREYKQIINALKLEADRLSVKVETYSLGDKIEELNKASSDVHLEVMRYFREKIGTPDEKKSLEEVVRSCQKQFDVLRNIELFLERSLRVKKWKKKTKKETAQ